MDVDNGQAAMSASQPLSPHSIDVKNSTEHHLPSKADALTPPTSEEMNHEIKLENDDSELSDLDMSDDDEEIEPDHYWDDGKIPVFKPTMEQFRSFKKYITKIDKYGMKSGIVKVIPPQEWRDSLIALDEMVKRIRIKNPITQEFVGTFGTYTQQNMEKQRSYNLPEWKALTESPQYQPPAKRGERRKNQEKVVRGAGNTRGRVAKAKEEETATPSPRGKPGRRGRGGARGGAKARVKDEPDEEGSPAPRAGTQEKPNKRRGRPVGGGQNRSVASRRLNNIAEAVDWVDEEAFKDFDYRMEGLDEFTPERCAELEAQYWKSLGFNQPMYAADMPGSLFDDKTTSWNVAKLENLLDVLGTKVPGVNTAYLYLGMWKATFAWHLEDVDLYSINYIHFGAPKQWYSISQEDARRFESAMKSVWPVDYKHCDQFLRHKTYLISPEVLAKQYNVKVNKLVHYEGEFVITYPYGYHSGFNLGYNCAESVNFATESWLDYGRIARKCNCEADNVWVDVAEIERKLRGEPTPEYYEETDDDDSELDEEDSKLPTPPASVKGQKTAGRKRKRDDKKEVKQKKKKKIRIRVKSSSFEPCVMCPNENAWEPLLPTDTGKKAHRSCATFTPETWIAEVNGIEQVCGVATIDKARLELKCNFCRSKRGAVFQCSSRKCTRAFHATCALAAGVQIDKGPVPTFGEDGTEYFEEGYDFRCKFHRPKMAKSTTTETLENSKRVLAFARDVKPNDVVQAQLIGGDVFAGLVLENRHSEQSLLVEVLPDGDKVELEWKYLAVLNPEQSQRPKPSPLAIPMPEGMNKQLVSIGNRQDGVPSVEEPFTEGSEHKWCEFRNVHTPPQGFTVGKYQPLRTTVDLSAPDQLYYFIGDKSTDAKPLFTDIPGSKVHQPKSNFMDRVSPKPVQPYHRQNATTTYSAGTPSRYSFVEQAIQPRNGSYSYKPKNRDVAGPQTPGLQRKASDIAQQAPTAADMMAAFQRANSAASLGKSSTKSRSPTPLQPFPQTQYYSHHVLPAAYQEYSGFTKEVRRQSQSASRRPSFAAATVPDWKYAPPAMINGTMPPAALHNKSVSVDTRPNAGYFGQPLTPITTSSTDDKSFTRPQTSQGVTDLLSDPKITQSAHFRSASEHWIPPSRRLSSVGQYPSDMPGTPSITQALSMANGLNTRPQQNPNFQFPQRPVDPATYTRNSFGQVYATHTNNWQGSPKAPTPSPVSNPHTPGFPDTMSLDDCIKVEPLETSTPMKMNYGFGPGPMLPQMESAHNVHEAWR